MHYTVIREQNKSKMTIPTAISSSSSSNHQTAKSYWLRPFCVGLMLSSACAWFCSSTFATSTGKPFILAKWAIAQWLPLSMADKWQVEAWEHWQETLLAEKRPEKETISEIPSINVQEFRGHDTSELLQFLEDTYGRDWRSKPLLLKGLWDLNELHSKASTRRLSRQGLLQQDLIIPYFTDARKYGALSPDAHAPVKEIVANITKGDPLKIGTQLVVQKYPELVREVAPTDIVTALFGSHFQPKDVVNAFGISFLPPLTTVPLFVAKAIPNSNQQTQNAFTALHCEPIGNVAVQLEGEKQWTLVSPQYSFWVKPSASPDGRAFFASGMTSEQQLAKVPRYYATTSAGDAMWVPTWTWHRVDYTTKSSTTTTDAAAPQGDHDSGYLAIGASLFHFRPTEFVFNNQLFAMLIIPNLIKEVLQFNTQ